MKTHMLSYRPEYGPWQKMHQRCTNPNDEDYKRYGARGITVCERWKDFGAFFSDMGPRPDGYSLERKDNNLGYSSENCIWANRITQNSNRRNNVYIEHNGETKTLAEWGRVTGVNNPVAQRRIQLGWNIKQAVGLEPPPERKKQDRSQTGRLLTYNGKTQNMASWAREYGMSKEALWNRINKHGWALEEALSTPDGRTGERNRARRICAVRGGVTKTLNEWCQELGLKYETVLMRMRRQGLTAEEALDFSRHRG